MVSSQLAHKLAEEKYDWENLRRSEKIARVILEDCLDRRGIAGQFSSCDDEVLEEILSSWSEIIERFPT